MENSIEFFLREHKFPNHNSVKRVIKEGTGEISDVDSIFKLEIKAYRCSDFQKLNIPAQRTIRILKFQLNDPINSMSALDNIVLSMRNGEEAWILIPESYHQENEEPWESIWYRAHVKSIEITRAKSPEKWPFLREHKIGPNKAIKKRVISEGYGETPKINMLLTYYYTMMKQDGTEKEPYTYKSHVLAKIPTTDTHLCIFYALFTMREGEDCLLYVPPGFLKNKYNGGLWVSIQLIYLNNVENALYPQLQPFLREENLGYGVIKRVLKEGEGEVISNASKLWVEIEGWLEDSFQFQKFKEETFSLLKTGKEYGIFQKLLLKTMKKGEIALVKAPPGTHLYDEMLEVETLWLKYKLVEYLEVLPNLNDIKDIAQKIPYCVNAKNVANRLLSSGVRGESKAIYNTINSSLNAKSTVVESLDQETKNQYYSLKAVVLSNLALVHLKDAEELSDKGAVENNIKKVIDFCDKSLSLQPANVKCFYRKAKALFIKKEFEKCKENLDAAKKIEPKNEDVISLLRKTMVEIREENKREKQVFQEVFDKERWERQAKIDEDYENAKKDEEDYKIEEEQEKEILKWMEKLQTTGVNIGGIDAINLLMTNENS